VDPQVARGVVDREAAEAACHVGVELRDDLQLRRGDCRVAEETDRSDREPPSGRVAEGPAS
jgi:hypothetical protein